jgi:hypothetical protein
MHGGPQMEIGMDLLEKTISFLERGNFKEGVCMCGDDMDHHSHPMHSGHSPVDVGEYFQYNLIQELKEIMKPNPITPFRCDEICTQYPGCQCCPDYPV